jgi:hypothetical protein
MIAPNSPLFNINSFMAVAGLNQTAMDTFPEGRVADGQELSR